MVRRPPHPHAVWPFAEDALAGAEPGVVGTATELDYEKIAALDPDLIVGIGYGITEPEYDRLSQIAPTLARPADRIDHGVPWQEHTRLIGRAVGKVELAEELIADVEEQFAAVRAEHPEFPGATAVMGLVGVCPRHWTRSCRGWPPPSLVTPRPPPSSTHRDGRTGPARIPLVPSATCDVSPHRPSRSS